MKTIQLHTGEYAIVDDCDFEYLSKWKWYLSNGYAISGNGRKKMHRLILNAKDGELVDHKDRIKLNNTRNNLRIVDKEGNVHNQKKRTNTINNYKGTHYVKKLGLWQSRCRIYKNDYYLGLYKSEIAAAIAYNRKAVELSDCILLNYINLPEREQDEILVSDLSKIIPAEKVSKAKGIYWIRKSGGMKCGKWTVMIRVNGKNKYFGRFIHEQDAINKLNTLNINNT